MPSDSRQSLVVAVLLGTLASGLLFSASLMVPVVGLMAGALAPFPIMLYRLRSGRVAALTIVCFVLAGLVSLWGGGAGLQFFLQCGLIALVLPELMLRGYGTVRAVLWTTACAVTAICGVALLFIVGSGQNLQPVLHAEITSGMTRALQVYKQGGMDPADLEQVTGIMEVMARLLVRTYPALVTVLFMGITAMNALFLRKLPDADTLGIGGEGTFATFRLPDLLVWLLIAAGFSSLAPTSLVAVPALNVLIVLCSMYFIQGLAIIHVISGRVAYSGTFRIIFYLLLLFQPYLFLLVTALGVFDLWADFRSPKKQKNL